MWCKEDALDEGVDVAEFEQSGGSVSHGVVEAVASYSDTAPTAMEPLYTVINPDALDALIEHAASDLASPVRVTFHYEGVAVSVDSTGTIQLVEVN